jgi:hypothetical protein
MVHLHDMLLLTALPLFGFRQEQKTVDLLLFEHRPKSTPLGIECMSFLRHACNSGFTVARGQHFPVQL